MYVERRIMFDGVFDADRLIDKLDDAVESGELTEEETREIYREECADFWRQVNDMYWGM